MLSVGDLWHVTHLPLVAKHPVVSPNPLRGITAGHTAVYVCNHDVCEVRQQLVTHDRPNMSLCSVFAKHPSCIVTLQKESCS